MKRLLTADPAQEARTQSVLLDRLERAFSQRVEAEISSASKAMLSEYETTGSAPAAPLMHFNRMTQLYSDMAAISIQAFGGRVMDAIQAQDLHPVEEKSFEDMFQRLAEFFISMEEIRQRIAAVSEHTRNTIIELIARGQEDGLGVEAIARMISGRLPGIARARARIIARTETHGAANYGAHSTAKETGFVTRKEWISTEDHRTRDFGEGDGVIDEYDHRSMNGQIVHMDQPFLMPWKNGDPIRIMYPGQVGMPAGAVINCRCAVAYVVD